jgi:hypothetical protein
MGKWKTKPREYKLSEESAREQVMELLEFYGVELKDDSGGSDKGITADDILDDLADYYRMGLLENKQDEKLGFCVIQHLKNGQTLVYREMKGKDRLVHSGYSMEKDYTKKAAAILGKLCGLGEDAVIGLMKDDYKAASTLAFVFFVV